MGALARTSRDTFGGAHWPVRHLPQVVKGGALSARFARTARMAVLVALLLSAGAALGCAPKPARQVTSRATRPAVPSSTTVKLGLRVTAVGKRSVTVEAKCLNTSTGPMTFTAEQATCRVIARKVLKSSVGASSTLQLRNEMAVGAGGSQASSLTVEPELTLDGTGDVLLPDSGNYVIQAEMVALSGVRSSSVTVSAP